MVAKSFQLQYSLGNELMNSVLASCNLHSGLCRRNEFLLKTINELV